MLRRRAEEETQAKWRGEKERERGGRERGVCSADPIKTLHYIQPIICEVNVDNSSDVRDDCRQPKSVSPFTSFLLEFFKAFSSSRCLCRPIIMVSALKEDYVTTNTTNATITFTFVTNAIIVIAAATLAADDFQFGVANAADVTIVQSS